jgi:hypothetical protein
MANVTCMFPVFFIQGDGASLSFLISLKTTPLLFDKFTVINFPKNVDGVSIAGARDSFGNDVSAQTSVIFSGSAVTLNFTTAFSDLRTFTLQFEFLGG